MKIIHLVSTYPPYRGGMGNVTYELVERLAQRGHDVSVIVPKDEHQREGEKVVPVKSFFSYGNSAFIPGLYRHLKKADLIHLHYPFFGGAETVALFKKQYPKIPLVITYHMDTVGGGWLGAFFAAYKKIFFPWIIKQADAVLVSSLDYAKNSQVAKYMDDRFIELPFGVDEALRTKHGQHARQVRILFVGGLDEAHYFKGVDVLIKALAMLRRREWKEVGGADLQLRIVGHGNRRIFYECQVLEHKLSEIVEFCGAVSLPRLIEEYQEADVTVLPSVDQSEAFGLVLIESMACGTPVIASNLPGVRSVVDNGKTGLLVKPNDVRSLADALKRMSSAACSHSPEYNKMRKACVKRVDALYRWPEIIDRLEKVYKSLTK